MPRIVIALGANNKAGLRRGEENPSLHRWRTYAFAFALIGMLFHAGSVVWHNAAMLGSVLERNALAQALGKYCHGGTATIGSSDVLPDLPQPNQDQTTCPICKGAVAAFAILPVVELPLHRPDVTSARIEVVGRIIAIRLARLRPPSRAPPFPV